MTMIVIPRLLHSLTTNLQPLFYADGLNNVLINGSDSGLTDLDMYYFKVNRAYGDSSGRPLGDYPTFDDFEPNVDEFRIVGDISADPVGISSIRAW